MQIFQITGAASPRIHVSETYNVFMKRFMSVCICCLVGTAAAMGPGGSSGTGGSSSGTGGSVLQPEVGISAIQVYNQGVDLMHAKKFAAARVEFEQAIQLKPKMAETYEYRAMLLSRMGRKADAEKDLATLKKLNPKLAGEL